MSGPLQKVVRPIAQGIASVFAALLLTKPALAVDYTWTGAADSASTNTANWNPNGNPGVTDNILIDTSVTNSTNIPSGNWDRRGTGTTTISGTGIVNLTLGSARFLNFGAFNMLGGQFNQTGEYFLVGNGGIGTFVHSGGTVTSNHSRGFFLSDNNASQLGTSYTLSAGGTLTVNSLASFSPTQESERRLRSVWFGKGGETTVSAGITGDLFRVTGGTATFTHSLAANGTSDVLISRNSSLLIEGGITSFTDYNEFRVGYGLGGTNNSGTTPSGANGSNITVTGGTLDINGATPLVLGYADNGTFTLSGGIVSLDNSIQIGRSGGGSGSFLMSGGQLTASDILWAGGTFTFNGGDIYLTGDRTSIYSETWFNETSGATAIYDAGLNQTHLSGVPEPATTLSLVGGILLLAVRRRRLS
jgi:hypothetical protein